MKRLALALSVCSLLCAQQGPLTDGRLMGLAQAGVSETELLRLIATAPSIDFDLRPVSTDALMKIGVSENVIKAMAARESGQSIAPSYSSATSAPAAAVVLPAAAMPFGPAETPTRPSPTPPVTTSTPPRMDSRTRIFIGETSEWQASSFNIAHSAASFSGFSGAAGAGSFGMSHAGLMKLTISVMNHVNRHCPGTLIVNRPDLADLFVRLDQSTSMWARHDDMAVFNRAGEMVFVTSTHSISKDAKRFCNSIALQHP
jgi:hypothetical protein